MYSSSQKFPRGPASSRGGSNSKRKSYPPPPPPQRHSTPSSNNRLSLGPNSNSRHRTSSSSSAPPPPPPQLTADESFRLVSDEPLSLAAIIRLIPGLVDDIRRVEAQGGAARIKFDPRQNNEGNVIDVGDKQYSFTWATEKDCDIYEERQGGEDGNGLLVETGFAWRKLNTKRVLDQSTKEEIKKRSIECQQSLKSRKAIVLDPANPTTKNQMKALASAEASPWKHKQKKDFQKRNTESSQAVGPTKPVHRPGLSSTTSTKGRPSTSPMPSPQNQYISFASPSARGRVSENRTIYDPTTIGTKAKEKTSSSDKILSPLVSAGVHEEAPARDIQGARALDLQQLLVTLLKDNSKGMSLKALEKSVGDVSTSSSARRIEPILKKIATYESSGRYILKPGAELGNMKSSPEDNHQQIESKNIYGGVPAPDSGFVGKSAAGDIEEQVPLNNNFEEELNVVGTFDPSQHLTDLFGDDEAPDHKEAKAASSSNSDTDSASSDSDTNTASQSRSRSPPGSVSASSSDSEADSSNSKETSDVEIDIMSDGDKEPKKLQDKEPVLSETLIPWSMPEARTDGNNGDHEDYASEDIDIDIENDFLGDNEADLATSSHGLGVTTESKKIAPQDHDQHVVDEQEYDGDKFKHGRSGSILSSENKSKRGSSAVHMEQNFENVKRLKGRSLAQSSVPEHLGSDTLPNPSHTLEVTSNVDHLDNNRLQTSNRLNRNGNANGTIAKEREYSHQIPGKSNVEALQSVRRPPVRSHTTNNTDKPPAKNPLTSGLDANDHQMNVPEKLYDTSTSRNFGLSPKGTSKADFDKSPSKGRKLQRELSVLELGELRETLVEESEISKNPFERVGSFKQSEAKLGTGSRYTNVKVNSTNQPTLDPGNTSSPNLKGGPRKPDSLSKRRSPEPRSAHVEAESLSNKAVDPNRMEYGEGFANQRTDVEGYGETQRKSYDNAAHEDSRQELKSHRSKGNKSRKSKAMGDSGNKKGDVSVGRMDKRKRNESSSDDNASYSKYEKDGPELKRPIKSFSEYKEYVLEYRDKYDSYCSLNKILENYRNEFQKLGLDLESAKGKNTERYYGILAQLRESYRQCGTRHKRLKKIFIVLHEELKDLKQRIKDFAVDYMRD